MALQILNMPLFTVETNRREELNYAEPTQPTSTPEPVHTHIHNYTAHFELYKQHRYIGTHYKCYYTHTHMHTYLGCA